MTITITKQFVPFGASSRPSIFLFNHNGGKYCLVASRQYYWHFEICLTLEWEIERLLWIAFYQNTQNDKCFFPSIPKDILKKIIAFLGGESQSISDGKKRKRIIKNDYCQTKSLLL